MTIRSKCHEDFALQTGRIGDDWRATSEDIYLKDLDLDLGVESCSHLRPSLMTRRALKWPRFLHWTLNSSIWALSKVFLDLTREGGRGSSCPSKVMCVPRKN